MTKLEAILNNYGTARIAAQGTILFSRNSPATGLYYVKKGSVGVYRDSHRLPLGYHQAGSWNPHP